MHAHGAQVNGRVLPVISDPPLQLVRADTRHRLSTLAHTAVERGIESGTLACSDITLWEVALLHARGRIDNCSGITSSEYLGDILTAMRMQVLPITAEIAELSQGTDFPNGDPADRLIAATALATRAPLVTADEKLHRIPGLRHIW